MSVLGLDIGGANIKVAHSGGLAWQQPYELWKDPAGLASALRALLDTVPRFDRLAVTMTGELCDCFESKRQGVNAILDAVEAVAGTTPVLVWQNDGRFVDVAGARQEPLRTAAANWLALATYAGRFAAAGPGLLIDIGSTTTDIVPLLDGQPVPRGRTDPERLRCFELLYIGVRRTPLCALLQGHGHAAELFATTLDAFLVLDQLPEDANDRHTADGRPATKAAAHARLARMRCADLETSTETERLELARGVHRAMTGRLRAGIAVQTSVIPWPPRTVVVAGCGEFLAREVLSDMRLAPVVSLAETLGSEISQAACAHALAVLAVGRAS